MHTGQHYDANMSDAFFRDLGLPQPRLQPRRRQRHARRADGRRHDRLRAGRLAERPDWLVVVGDVNSTAACAMVGAKLRIPVVHLEAGLRSGDRRMPEEINRLVTDAIGDVLWTPSPDADENLNREGVPADRIDRVGNIMIDSFEMMRGSIEADSHASVLGYARGVRSRHPASSLERRRPSRRSRNSSSNSWRSPGDCQLVFAIHPRTRRRLQDFGLFDRLRSSSDVRIVDPLGYLQFMNLVDRARRRSVTDSGGVQEETTYLGYSLPDAARKHGASSHHHRRNKPPDQAGRAISGRAHGARRHVAHRAAPCALGRPRGRSLCDGTATSVRSGLTLAGPRIVPMQARSAATEQRNAVHLEAQLHASRYAIASHSSCPR